jgi:hypothetical protein
MAEHAPHRPIPLPINFDGIPVELRYPNQWILWRYKWKEGDDGKPGKWDKPPYQPNGKHARSTASFTWSSFETVKKAYENGLNLPVDDPLHFDGLGFVPCVVPRAENHINLGDLDKCRDKETGEISLEALEDLQSINSYCEVSPSGTGVRFIAKGNPPFSDGKAGRKKGKIELYQGGHYLTITGQRLDGYPQAIEHRAEELNLFYQKHFSELDQEPKSESNHETRLTDGEIIAMASQARNSDKFLKLMGGDWAGVVREDGTPLYPSQSEADLGFCEMLAFYTTNEDQIDRVFRRSRLYRDKWERADYRQETIRLAIERTKEHYNNGGEKDPEIRKVSTADRVGTIGVCLKTGAVKKVVEIPRGDGTKERFLGWISDCAVHIHTETRADEDTEFIFVGVGAVDKRVVKFTLPASYLAEPRKFKAALINAFGAKNKVGELNFEIVQSMSLNPRVMRRVEMPEWDGAIPLIPGVGLMEDVEYRLSPITPAEVYDGDINVAKECLRKLLQVHKYSHILVAAVLGAPAFSRWHNNDRFGVGLWGLTGSLKTSVAQAALSVYGTGYMDDDAILKHGKAGATQVATLEVLAGAGILPQLLDNVKTVDEKDSLQYISTIQAVIEGREKQRGKKDGGLRDTRKFCTTPIVTGEIRPEEASTTARLLNLTWIRPDDFESLSYVQANVSAMPVIGYHWLRFLARTALNLVDGFSEARSRKMAEFSHKRYTNPGKLATIYTLLRSVWGMLCESPFGDVFNEFTSKFVASLDQAIEDQGMTVSEETEVAKFLTGLKELLASDPHIVQDMAVTKTIMGKPVIGKWTEEGLFLLPNETLAELANTKVFTQKPTVDSLTKALHAAGKLVVKDAGHLKPERRINGTRTRGWLLTPETCPVPSPGTGDTKNDNGKLNVADFAGVSEEKRENIFEGNFDDYQTKQKELSQSTGDTGDIGDGIDANRVIDNGFIGPESVAGSVACGQKNGDVAIFLMKRDHVGLVLASRELQRFSALILSSKANRTPADALRFLQQAEALGLDVCERVSGEPDQWTWLEEIPATNTEVGPEEAKA